MIAYDWYEVVDGNAPLEQGDIIDNCPIIIPPKKITPGKRSVVHGLKYDVIIMTQSCDLDHKKVDLVLLCPFWTLAEAERIDEKFKGAKAKEKLRQGFLPGYHLINKCEIEGFERDFLIIDFRNVYSVTFEFLVDFAKSKDKRVRLLPPYKEHLSQAFARFFMRVGLPTDIPPFK